MRNAEPSSGVKINGGVGVAENIFHMLNTRK